MNIVYIHHMTGLNSIQTAPRLIFFYEATVYLDWPRNFMEMSPFKPYLSPLSTCFLLTWHYVTSSVKISLNYLRMNVSINKWVSKLMSEWVSPLSLKISTTQALCLDLHTGLMSYYCSITWNSSICVPLGFLPEWRDKWNSNFSWNYVCSFTVLLLHYVQFDMLW